MNQKPDHLERHTSDVQRAVLWGQMEASVCQNFHLLKGGARLCELFNVDQVSHEKGVRTGVYFKHNLSYQVCKGKCTYQENTDSSWIY